MSSHPFQRERLEELLVASTNETFSEEERDELNAMLRGSEAARSLAAQFLSLDAALADSLGASEASSLYVKNNRTAKNERRLQNLLVFSLRREVWLTAAAAAVILCGWLGWRSISSNPDSVVEAVSFVQHASRSTALVVGVGFKPGDWIRFEKGRVAVRFESGAKLAVEGPADFQILSNNGARMTRGRATIRVPGKIKGFMLDTPAERIVDLGTSFGVNIEQNGATSISVFEGSVELRGKQHGSGPQQLSAGESVRVAGNLVAPSDIPYDVSDYLPTWRTSFGVEAIDGAMRVAEPSERAMPGKTVDRNRLLIFPERESVQLLSGFVVNATEPGEYRFPNGLKHVVALQSPMVVDSYLVQFNPGQSVTAESPNRFSGTLKFDRPVVGLLFRAMMLDESDAMLGLPAADFGDIFRRGINASDEVSLSVDRRTLTVSFDVINGVDQIRVLVASNLSVPY